MCLKVTTFFFFFCIVHLLFFKYMLIPENYLLYFYLLYCLKVSTIPNSATLLAQCATRWLEFASPPPWTLQLDYQQLLQSNELTIDYQGPILSPVTMFFSVPWAYGITSSVLVWPDLSPATCDRRVPWHSIFDGGHVSQAHWPQSSVYLGLSWIEGVVWIRGEQTEARSHPNKIWVCPLPILAT